MALLLDTTVLIDVLRGRPDIELRWRAARRAERLYVCAVTVEEISRGLRPGEEWTIKQLFDALRMAPLGRSEGERAGSWRRGFAERGVTLWQADCLVAAAAVGIDARLATANVADFPMPELVVEPWPSS